MLNLLDLRARELTARELNTLLPRAEIDVEAALKAVEPVLADVATRGEQAIIEWSEKFDRCRPPRLRVSQAAREEALAQLDPKVRRALEIAITNARAGHRAQLPQPATTTIIPGGIVKQRWIPVKRVGLYVPGGLAVYPSSVVMNVVAAQVAGVESIAVASPPQAAFDGQVHPTILAACELLGVNEIYAMGGAQAIGAFAYGFTTSEGESCAPVDVVTGPGNIYVAAAKRAVQAVCGIDAEAGTTEIAIIADGEANPAYLARDLISQAEHDPAAASVLITDSEELAAKVNERITQFAAQTTHAQRVRTALSGPQSGIILTRDLQHSVEVANTYGAEHLEIQTRNPEEVSEQIYNAGAIFLGPYSPVPLGDYLGGSNHVLPTGGTARYASGLNVHAFIKSVQEVNYTRQALAQLAQPLSDLARAEDLPAHADAVNARASDSGELAAETNLEGTGQSSNRATETEVGQ
ncbi:MAG: histidinol dehydrogenase [Actinomycetaceae bacterium]|nr:histidinol dehydrogenase [Actinomycetaceae bacterium]